MNQREQHLYKMILDARTLHEELKSHQNADKLGPLKQKIEDFLYSIEYGQYPYLERVAVMFDEAPILNEAYAFPRGTLVQEIKKIKGY